MSKVFLVVDMPTDCEDCPLFRDSNKGMRECKAKRAGTEWDYYKVRPDWCPLREVPEKMQVCGKYPQADGITPSYKIGYNACIDEILKGSE